MSIEQAVRQAQFKNEYHRLRVNLLYTNGWLRSHIKSFLAPFEITQQQFNILRILRGANPDPISTLQIRERMIDQMSDVSRLVDRLEKKALVLKKPCKDDRRLVDVFITETGQGLLETIDKEIFQLDAALGALTEEEATTLNELLNKMRTPPNVDAE